MQKLAIRLLAIIATFGLLVLADPADAAKPPGQESMHFDSFMNTQIDPVVEEQSDTSLDPSTWVRNNTGGCTWDVDDHWHLWAQNDWLDAGQLVSIDTCRIAESHAFQVPSKPFPTATNGMHAVVVDVVSPSPQLSVGVCFVPGGCFTVPRTLQANGTWKYFWCGWPMYQSVSDLVEIPNSNGGLGVFTEQHVSIRNQSATRVRNIYATVQQLGWQQDAVYNVVGCQLMGWTPNWPTGAGDLDTWTGDVIHTGT